MGGKPGAGRARAARDCFWLEIWERAIGVANTGRCSLGEEMGGKADVSSEGKDNGKRGGNRKGSPLWAAVLQERGAAKTQGGVGVFVAVVVLLFKGKESNLSRS